MDTHLRVARWSLDEFPLPGRLFVDLIERLYRRDAFFRGGLPVAGLRTGAADLRLPLLTVANPDSMVIPPGSVLPVHEAAPHPASRHLWYAGDRGVMVQHVGILVGRTAHRRLWPEILAWLAARWAEA